MSKKGIASKATGKLGREIVHQLLCLLLESQLSLSSADEQQLLAKMTVR